jgi:hypothetical protein
LLFTEKPFFILEGEIKTFHDKHKLKKLMTTKQHHKRYLKESYTQKRKINTTIKI